MQRLEVSGAVRPLEWSLGVKGLAVCRSISDGDQQLWMKLVNEGIQNPES